MFRAFDCQLRSPSNMAANEMLGRAAGPFAALCNSSSSSRLVARTACLLAPSPLTEDLTNNRKDEMGGLGHTSLGS